MNVTVFTNQKEKYLPAWTKKCVVYNTQETEFKNILAVSNEVYANPYVDGKFVSRGDDLIIILINSTYYNIYNYTADPLTTIVNNLISVGNHINIYDLATHKSHRLVVPDRTEVMHKRLQQTKYLGSKYKVIKSEFYKTMYEKYSNFFKTTDCTRWPEFIVDISVSAHILQSAMLDIQQCKSEMQLIRPIPKSADELLSEATLYEHDITPAYIEAPDWHVQVNKEVTTFDRSKSDKSKCAINDVYVTGKNYNHSQQHIITTYDLAIAQQHYEYLASHGLLEPTRDEKETRYTELKEILFTTSREDMLANTEYYFELLIEYQELEAELGEFVTSFFNLTI